MAHPSATKKRMGKSEYRDKIFDQKVVIVLRFLFEEIMGRGQIYQIDTG